MVLWLIVLSPLIFLVSGWAWRYQLRVLNVTRAGAARVAGRPGTVTDVQLTSVLIDGPIALIGFEAATTASHAGPSSLAPTPRHRQSLVVSLDPDAEACIAALQEWEASGVPVVMWRDGSGGRLELSLLRSGQRVGLCVVPH
jgi:hypothetical protein